MKTSKRHLVSLLLKWAGNNKWYLLGSICAAFMSGLMTIVPYYGVYKIIEGAYNKNLTGETILLMGSLIGLSLVLRFSLFGLSGILSHKGAYNTLFEVRSMVAEHMAKMPLGLLNDRNTGEIKTLLNEKIEKLELFLAHHLPEFLFYLVGPIAIFIYLFMLNYLLALFTLVPLIVAFLVMGLMFKGVGKMMTRANKAIADLNATIIEYINGMKTIKALGLSSDSFHKYKRVVDEEHAIWCDMSRHLGPYFSAYIILLECGLLIIVPLGGYWFLKGTISASIFIVFAFVGTLYLTEIRPLQELGSNFARVLGAIEEVEDLLNEPIYTGHQPFPKKVQIDVEEVSFSYDGQTEILSDCNVSIKALEKVAIVGPSGAGKSTLVQLISRFYDVTGGQIKIGGCDVKEIDYEELLGHISIVFQQTFLSRGTVLENIRMGQEASLESVKAAAKKAQIHDFIMSLPDQYDTKIGAYSTRFSGGEKQRVAIARAILKDAPLLILDEATSAADPENQVEIDKAIDHLCQGKTVIIIAHRLGVVKKCDKVLVVNNGATEAFGRHEDLLKSSDYYKGIWFAYETARETVYRTRGGEDHGV